MLKDYLKSEAERNHGNRRLYERFLKRATKTSEIVVGHHITFMGEDGEPNEIPAADTMMFCHELMSAVFGAKSGLIMSTLAKHKAEQRDFLLGGYLDAVEAEEKESATAPA